MNAEIREPSNFYGKTFYYHNISIIEKEKERERDFGIFVSL